MNEKEKSETIDTYNKSALKLAEKFDNTGARVEDIFRGFSYFNCKDLKVVELGCGNGRDAGEILKYTNDYLGIDISEEFVKIAKENFPEANFIKADLENFDFPKNRDIIFSFASLLHSDKEKVKDIFEKAHNALNKGGIFYISLKYGDYHKEVKNDEFGTRFFYFYTPELISDIAGNLFETIFKDFQDLRGQKWFTIVLKKVA